MASLDLDDLPPRVANLLTGLAAGDELILVQGGVVVGRLAFEAADPVASAPDPEAEPDRARLHQHEVFEQFRSLMEDDY